MSSRGAIRKAPESALLIFARAPDPGRVKTRLVPLLGEKGAARLHARLVERALKTAVAAGFASVDLVIEAVFEDLHVKHQVVREVERHLPAHAIVAKHKNQRGQRRHEGRADIGDGQIVGKAIERHKPRQRPPRQRQNIDERKE